MAGALLEDLAAEGAHEPEVAGTAIRKVLKDQIDHLMQMEEPEAGEPRQFLADGHFAD